MKIVATGSYCSRRRTSPCLFQWFGKNCCFKEAHKLFCKLLVNILMMCNKLFMKMLAITVLRYCVTLLCFIFTFQKHDAEIINIDIASSGKYIMTCSKDTSIKLWDLKGMLIIKFYVSRPAFSKDFIHSSIFPKI